MTFEEMAQENVRASYIAAANALEMALSVQLISHDTIVKKLTEAGAITLDQAADINLEAAAIVESANPDGLAGSAAEPVFEVLARHATALREQAGKAALAGAPSGVRQ